MKRILFILLVFCNATPGLAQGGNIDSLKSELSKAKEETTRVILLTQLAEANVRLYPDTALIYARESSKLAKEIKFTKGEYYSTVRLAESWWALGEYSTGINLLLPKIRALQDAHEQDIMLLAYHILADCYRDQGDYKEALAYDFKIQNLVIQQPPCTLCNISYAAIAYLYLETGQADSSYFYLVRSLNFPPAYGLKGWPFFTAGRIYASRKTYDSAFFYYRESSLAFIQENNLKDLAGVYNSVAGLFKITGATDSSIFYAYKSLSVSLPKRFAKEAMDAYIQLSIAYEPLNTDSALHYYKMAITAKDSLYNQEKQRQIWSYQFNEQLRQQEAEQKQQNLQSEIKLYSSLAALLVFLVITFILFRNNRHKQKAYRLLQKQKQEIDFQKTKVEKTLDELKSAQQQLIQSEKMASLGELTAGIAHEIQNPLNFVNNFSEVNREMVDEASGEMDKCNYDEVKNILHDIKDNSEKINHHGKRADAIVKGMLQHSRSSTGIKELTDINKLADEYLRLAFHGIRAKDKSFNAKVETDFDNSIEKVSIVSQDIGRVLLNMINNAFYAVNEKQKQNINGYEPAVTVRTEKQDGQVQVSIEDNGNGIPAAVKEKVFQPFFTTKPAGEGTGLGLSLAYDIIKAHGGEISVKTKDGEGSEFVIILNA